MIYTAVCQVKKCVWFCRLLCCYVVQRFGYFRVRTQRSLPTLATCFICPVLTSCLWSTQFCLSPLCLHFASALVLSPAYLHSVHILHLHYLVVIQPPKHPSLVSALLISGSTAPASCPVQLIDQQCKIQVLKLHGKLLLSMIFCSDTCIVHIKYL